MAQIRRVDIDMKWQVSGAPRFSPYRYPPTIPLLPGHYRASFFFAGEPLAEIHGVTVKPFEPDAGNAAEGSVRWSCVAEDDDHTTLSKKPSDLR
jgi:hypothetical protein